MKFNTIEEALEDYAQGKFIVVLDDEDRENEGDLMCSAELCTPEHVTFMSHFAHGLICVPITKARASELQLEMMVARNTALHETAFTVSVDYVHGTSTGISSGDRSATIRALADDSLTPADLGRPGHIFPLLAANGGVLQRAGHTEAAVDMSILAGLKPVGVICEIIGEDGEMSRAPQLFEFAKRHNLKIITIKDLIAYRIRKESLVHMMAETSLKTEYGEFQIKVYVNQSDGKEHVAMVKGKILSDEPALVRVHSECLTGDIFHSLHCDCGPQLNAALKQIEQAGTGVLLYMRQEGRGIGLVNKIKAYELQSKGMDTVEANTHLGFKPDAREYGIGAQILYDLGIRKMRLLTNNPTKRVGLASFGLEIVERVPIEVEANEVNREYMKTKKLKMGHFFDSV